MCIVKVVDENCISLEVTEEAQQQRRRGGVPTVTRQKDSAFAFDRVFGEDSTSAEVYEFTTSLLIDEVLNGFNCTCFAYGATGTLFNLFTNRKIFRFCLLSFFFCSSFIYFSKGSGKTHTMIGNAVQPGVMVITMNDLFKRIEDSKEKYDIKISYLEVYNETIRDLLVEGTRKLFVVLFTFCRIKTTCTER